MQSGIESMWGLTKIAALCRRVSAEHRWMFAIGVTALVAANLPILYAVVTTPPGTVFQGFVYNPPDGFSYLGWMRQGYEGSWMVTDRYTPEGTGAAVIAPFYVLLGKLAWLLDGDLRLAFHLGRVLTSLVWLAAVAAFCRSFLSRPSQRVLAFALMCFAGGLGWLAWGLGIQSIDIYNNDATGFLTLSGPPHLPLSQTLILGAVLSFMASLRDRRTWLVPVPGLLLAVEGFVHPYGVPLGLGVLGFVALLRMARQPGEGAVIAIRWWITLALAMSPLIYYQWLTATDPAWSSVTDSNGENLAPVQVSALVFGYGPLIALAVAALPYLVRKRRWDDLVLPLWVGLALAVATLPIEYGARFLGTVYPPLVVLSVRGLTLLQARWRVRTRRKNALPAIRASSGLRLAWGRAVLAVFLLAVVVPNVTLLEARSVLGRGIWSLETGRAAPFREPPVYLRHSQLDAIRWLSLRSEGAMVLASPTIGNVLPALSGNSVVAGHLDLTVDFYGKFSDVKRFFSAGMADAERRRLLDKYDVEYIYYGANERRYGPFDPSTVPGYLHEVFADQDVTIYQVDTAADADMSAAPVGP